MLGIFSKEEKTGNKKMIENLHKLKEKGTK